MVECPLQYTIISQACSVALLTIKTLPVEKLERQSACAAAITQSSSNRPQPRNAMSDVHRLKTRLPLQRLLLVLGLGLGDNATGVVGRDLLLDALAALLARELAGAELLRLGLPLGRVLLGGGERRVLTDRGVGSGVDLLDVYKSEMIASAWTSTHPRIRCHRRGRSRTAS